MMHSTSSDLISRGDDDSDGAAASSYSSSLNHVGSSMLPHDPSHSQRSIRWRTHLGLSVDDSAIEDRRLRFEELVQEHPYPTKSLLTLPDDDAGGGHENNSCEPSDEDGSNNDVPLDPLTAMVREEERKNRSMAELDLQYRKEKARRKRSNNNNRGVIEEDESYDRDAVALEVIDKDLDRLHTNQDKSMLRTVLFVYHCRHSPDPGYRQGMHEVAGYLLRALEEEDKDGDRASVEPQGEVYAMLEVVLTDISPAYDVPTDSDRKPLEALSQRVVTMVGKADPQLWDRLHHLQVPPAIYLTKWIRLLFGREVHDVLELWDVIFELSQTQPKTVPSLKPNNRPILAVLEALAAARLLHHRRQVLLGDDPLHFLMNVPVERDIAPIVELARPILAGQALLLPPIVMPPPQGGGGGVAAAGPTTTTTRGSPTSLRTSLMSMASTATTPSGGGPTATPAISTAFSTMRQHFTEALDKTSSISKRLYHEWENLAATTNDKNSWDEPTRSYDDDIWPAPTTTTTTTMSVTSAAITGTSAAPRSTVDPVDNPLGGAANRATPYAGAPTPTPSGTKLVCATSPQLVAAEMEMHVATLQNYCMNAQRTHRDVPPAVWESLAQLERLRQSLLQ